MTTQRTMLAGQGWQEILGIDVRSLALMRILFALVILIDLVIRATTLTAHYGDGGVLPRKALLAYWDEPWSFSIHLIHGAWQIQALFFVIAVVFALMLLVGWKTRFVTIVSWFLLVSLQNSNPLIIQGGDALLRLALFWAMFLPWGRVYSVDRAFSLEESPGEKRIFSVWTAAYLLQIGFLYLFASTIKGEGADWLLGNGVYYALSIDQFTTPIGEFLLGFPLLLMFLNFGVLWLQRVSFLLLFSPFFTRTVRTLGVVLLIFMHLGFTLGMNLGPFSWVSISALVGFVHTDIWEAFMRRLRSAQRFSLKIYYDMGCGFCKKSVFIVRTFFLLPETPLLPAQKYPEAYRDMEKHDSWVVEDFSLKQHFGFDAVISIAKSSPLLFLFAPIMKVHQMRVWGEKVYRFVASHRSRACELELPIRRPSYFFSKELLIFIGTLLIVYVFLWNLAGLPGTRFDSLMPRKLRWVGQLLAIDQRWSLFAPNPLKNDGWYVLVGKRRDGKEIDIFKNGGTISWEKPYNVSVLFSNERWRKYLMNLVSIKNTQFRQYYASYLCRNWNSTNDAEDMIEHVTIVFMLELTKPDYLIPSPEKVILHEQDCLDPQEPTSDDSLLICK